MHITLDQARALEATVRLGTIQKAAKSLNKGHSVIMYLIKSLEEQTQLTLFDRSGYRNRLTPEGHFILKYCQQLLATESEMSLLCEKLRSGWEPKLTVVYDGVVDFNFIGPALAHIAKLQSPTEIHVIAAYLDEVEQRFSQESGDLMLTILPIKQSEFNVLALPTITMSLVAHKSHPLAGKKRGKVTLDELKNYAYVKIQNTGGKLGLSTDEIAFASQIDVNDFATKKQALLLNLGYGWLPDYLIQSELKRGQLKILQTETENRHTLKPKLYHRPEEIMGKTARQFIEKLGLTNKLQ